MAFNEKYVTVTGGGLHDGSSEANAWTLDEAHANMVAGQRINIKAGTYTVSQQLRYWPIGTIAAPVGFRGYKTTIGDLDDKPTSQLVDGTDRPLIQTTNSSYLFLFDSSRSRLLVENIVFSSTTARPALYADASVSFYNRCKFLADPNGGFVNYPCVRTGGYPVFNLCHFDGNGGSNYQIFGTDKFVGCVFENLQYLSSSEFPQFSSCIIRNMSSAGLKVTGLGWLNMQGNTFYNISGNAIEADASSFPTRGILLVQNNVFHTISGDAIKSHTSGNFDFFCDNNLFYNVTGNNYSNNLNLNRNELVDTSDPFTDAAGGDYSLVSGSNGYNAAQPSLFEGLAIGSNRDCGAIQHQDPSGGGGATVHPLYAN